MVRPVAQAGIQAVKQVDHMKRLMKKMAPVALGALLATGAGLSLQAIGKSSDAAKVDKKIEIYRQLDLFGEVFDRIRREYVEDPDTRKLIEAAISGMLKSLDPHSSYLTPKSYNDMLVNIRGEFGGLGIEVTMENGVIKVVSPIDDTPAARAGVLAGDLIIKIDGKPVKGLTLNQAVEKMRGKPGTPITITVLRKGKKKPFDIRIVRDIIRIRSVKWSVEGGDIGYIRITQFNEQTEPRLKEAIADLEKKLGNRLKGFIIDLRNNPGGLLDQAWKVSDAFLDKGEIVSVRGRREAKRWDATPGDLAKGKPIVVLINGGSASASEIVAGALQDHKRAVLIGTRSFGKGSVQKIIPLPPDRGAIRLTTERYYTPSGRSIQATGITPDHVVEQELPPELKDKADQLRIKGEAGLEGHLKNDKAKEVSAPSLVYVPRDKAKDTQLKAAIRLLHGESIAMLEKKPADKDNKPATAAQDGTGGGERKPADKEAKAPGGERAE